MSLNKMLCRIVCFGMLVIASVGFSHAQTVVLVSPATKNVLPTGSNFTMNVNITTTENVHGFHVVFNLNNAVIRYAGRVEGSFLNGGGVFSTLFLTNPSPSPSVNSVTVDDAILGSDVVSGDGTLFTITFAPVGPGTSSVTLSAVDLRDGSNNSIPVTIQSGGVTATNPTASYVDPTYSSGNSGGHDFGFDAFTSIQNGVNAVVAGGTVNIAPGTYSGTTTISKNVVLSPTSGTPTIQNLTVNTSLVSLGGNIQVSGTLTLTSGVVSTGANKVIVSNSAPGAVAITSGSINGEIQRAIAAVSSSAYMFTDLNTQLIPNGSHGAITATIRSYPGTTPPHLGGATAINRYYTITPSGALTATLRLAYLVGEINGLNENTMSMYRSELGGPWALVPSSSGAPGSHYVEAPSVSQFSDWTMSDADNPLPIQLASFTGTISNGGDVTLTWVTLSEINNYGFFVQRKRLNEQEFIELPGSFVAGNGTTNEPHTYTFTDVMPGSGVWMYRLKQMDLNGAIHYTEPIQIDVVTDVKENKPTAYALKQNYPNPFNPSTVIEFSLPKAGYTSLKIYNLLGKEVATLVDGFMDVGQRSVRWDASPMPSGMYFYKLSSNGFVETKKLVLAK